MDEVRTLSQLLYALKQGYTVKDGRIIPPSYAESVPASGKVERSFCVSIADHIIMIHSLHREIYYLCEKFLSNEKSEITIEITSDDIDFEKKETGDTSFIPSDGYLETLAVYRKISEALILFDIFLMHGAVIAFGNRAFMFAAPSGTGKTTHIKKWLDMAKDVYVVNGDKPLIKLTDTEAIACGTPWCGKESLGTNTMVPLKAIVLMNRAEDNAIREITFDQAFMLLLQQTYRPNNDELVKKTLNLIKRLKEKVRFYLFECNNMKDDSFQVAYKALICNDE